MGHGALELVVVCRIGQGKLPGLNLWASWSMLVSQGLGGTLCVCDVSEESDRSMWHDINWITGLREDRREEWAATELTSLLLG